VVEEVVLVSYAGNFVEYESVVVKSVVVVVIASVVVEYSGEFLVDVPILLIPE